MFTRNVTDEKTVVEGGKEYVVRFRKVSHRSLQKARDVHEIQQIENTKKFPPEQVAEWKAEAQRRAAEEEARRDKGLPDEPKKPVKPEDYYKGAYDQEVILTAGLMDWQLKDNAEERGTFSDPKDVEDLGKEAAHDLFIAICTLSDPQKEEQAKG